MNWSPSWMPGFSSYSFTRCLAPACKEYVHSTIPPPNMTASPSVSKMPSWWSPASKITGFPEDLAMV